ncbi:hypothetical protein C8Q78DRAFT_185224 [Trametes maxima]|nr:hypothetical protein C8Q78DRAFT_185224 [Trametes maxima]
MAIPIYPNKRCLSGRPSATVRVRRRPDMYDESNVVKVSSLVHIRMEKAFCEDCDRIDDLAEAQEREASVSPSHSRSRRAYSLSLQDCRLSDRSCVQNDCSDSSGSCASEDADDSSTDTRSDDKQRDHLSEDAIPSPTDFDEERKAIARIVHDVRERNRPPSCNGEHDCD